MANLTRQGPLHDEVPVHSYGRTSSAPEWNVTDPHWKLEDIDPATPTHQGTWRHVWNWMAGENANGHSTQAANGNLSKHITALRDDDGSVRSRAADDLGTVR